MGGQLGKAFWYSKAGAGFVTSDYYYQRYPAWVEQFNNRQPHLKFNNQSWQLMLDQQKYVFNQEASNPDKTDLAGFGQAFPHPFGQSDSAYFTTKLSASPVGDELVADFAIKLLESEKLGRGEYTDYLSVSLSATDYVIHMFGPSSIEAEDNLLRLDRTLAKLFTHLESSVGLDNTLIVLSADHGAPDTPSFIHHHGGHNADYFGIETIKQSGVFEQLYKRFGLQETVVKQYADPYFYLDHSLIEAKGLSVAEVQGYLAQALMQIPGIEKAYSAADLETGKIGNNRLDKLVAQNHHSQRSGDIYLVYEPSVYINDFDGLKVASVHGSPWRYDTYVPIIFAGMGLTKQKIVREVTPYDIAPTLSNIAKITYPSGSTGAVLKEASLAK